MFRKLALCTILAFCVRPVLAQVTISNESPTYLDAAQAKLYTFGDRVLIEASGLKSERLSGAKIKVDRTDKYLILAFKKNPTEIAALISLEPNLYLLPGKVGDVYLVIIAPMDGSPQSFHEIRIPGIESPTNPPTNPPTTPPSDWSKFQTMAKDQAKLVGDPVVAKALGQGYVALKESIAAKALADAQKMVKAHTQLVMESRPIDPASQKDWRPFLVAIDQALTAAKISESKPYSEAIAAVGQGLLESTN